MEPITTVAASEVVKEIKHEAQGLLNRLLGPLVDEWGKSLRDSYVARRQKNLERIAAEANRIVDRANPLGLSRQETDFRTAVAVLEGASLEDEDSPLENRWAGLLASAASGTVLPSYPIILEQMTALEAVLLEKIGSASRPLQVLQLCEAIVTVTQNDVFEGIDNLMRLRLCVLKVPQAGQVVGRAHLTLELKSELELTVLGRKFLQAVEGPTPNRGSETEDGAGQ